MKRVKCKTCRETRPLTVKKAFCSEKCYARWVSDSAGAAGVKIAKSRTISLGKGLELLVWPGLRAVDLVEVDNPAVHLTFGADDLQRIISVLESAAALMPAKLDLLHGLHAGYNAGCRCGQCVAAESRYQIQKKQRHQDAQNEKRRQEKAPPAPATGAAADPDPGRQAASAA